MSIVVHQHLSLGLKSIVSKLAGKGDTVLDLGPLSTLITSEFLHLKCRCYIEDMHEYVEELSACNRDPIETLSNFMLEKPKETAFDFVLCWDLFNFLSLESIGHLMLLLKPYLKPGAMLHTIRYIGSATPKLPRHFKHTGGFNFVVKDSTLNAVDESHIKPQAHTTIMLLRTLPEFSLYDTALNQEGMMKDVAEYLLEYESLVKNRKMRRRLTSQDVVSYFSQDSESSAYEFKGLNKLFVNSSLRFKSILDVGPENGRKLDHLNEHCEQLYVEDIYSSISWHNRVTGNESQAISKQLLNFSSDIQFDLILMWDTFNYCTSIQIQKIGELLSNHLASGALLHILIHKGNSESLKPSQFEINEDFKVNIIDGTKDQHNKSFRSITELMRLLPQFKLYFHHLGDKVHQHNYQEFVLEYKG